MKSKMLNQGQQIDIQDLKSGKYIVSIQDDSGRIINITSLNAEAARPTIANYCTAKSGLKMFTKSLALELGKYNILTNAIGPSSGATATKPFSVAVSMQMAAMGSLDACLPAD